MGFIVSFLGFVGSIIAFVTSKNIHTPQQGQIRNGAAAAAVVFFIISLVQCFTVVPAGHVGVVDFFGKVSPTTLKPGVNPVNPLARIIRLSIKTQELNVKSDVPSREGLNVQLQVSVLFHLSPDIAGEIYKTVGTGYRQVILVPQLKSVIRGVTAGYEAKALYTSERQKLANEIRSEISKLVTPRGIVIESTPLRQVILPPKLTAAIEEKLQAEQESQRMEFILVKEGKEADRKRIEAKGIADFQKIVSRGISDQLLRWKGIEATEKLAGSQNSKVVVIGAGKNGLPLILGK